MSQRSLTAYFTEVANEWNQALKKTPGFVTRAVIAVFALGLMSVYYPPFLRWVENRPGVPLADPVLAVLPAWDLSIPIFCVLYSCVMWLLITLVKKPDLLMRALISYCVLVGFRIAAMSIVPLDPPEHLVPLVDRLVEFLGSTEKPLTRDLFFSGHTSLVALMFFYSQGTRQRVAVGCAVAIMGTAVLIQHVHYAIDVFVAPVFSYAAYRLMTRRWFAPLS